MTKPKKEDLVFPRRAATLRDLARFCHWAGFLPEIVFHSAAAPKAEKLTAARRRALRRALKKSRDSAP